MPGVSNAFVSFSVTGDQPGRAFIRLLLNRLSDQPDLRVWIYESPLGQIASGQNIADECRRKIEGSDLFMLLLTDQALESDYVAMEVSHALWTRGQRSLKIYPMVATTIGRECWPAQFQALMGFRGRKIDLVDEQVEDIVLDLCVSLGLTYVGPPDVNRRLPLRGRIIKELRSVQSSGEFDAADFKTLLRKCDRAVEAMVAGDVSRARRMAESILLDAEMSYGDYRPYYLRVFHAAAILAEAQRGLVSLESAFEAFDNIIADAGALLDANPYAGRGHARLSLGQYEAALADYTVAEKMLDSSDPALLYSQFRTCIMAKLPIDAGRIKQLEVLLQEGLVTQQMGDTARIASIVALAYAYNSDLDGVQRAWRYVFDPGEADSEVVCELCYWLESNLAGSSPWTALRLCEEILGKCLAAASPELEAARHLQLAHYLARIEFRLLEHEVARTRMAGLLALYPKHVLLCIDAAMFAIAGWDRTEAARLCNQVLDVPDHLQCQPALDRVAFERAVGQAYWLLGRAAESNECFRRSGLPLCDWCASTIPHLFGAATSSHRLSGFLS